MMLPTRDAERGFCRPLTVFGWNQVTGDNSTLAAGRQLLPRATDEAPQSINGKLHGSSNCYHSGVIDCAGCAAMSNDYRATDAVMFLNEINKEVKS
jgi:hypothetical protein